MRTYICVRASRTLAKLLGGVGCSFVVIGMCAVSWSPGLKTEGARTITSPGIPTDPSWTRKGHVVRLSLRCRLSKDRDRPRKAEEYVRGSKAKRHLARGPLALMEVPL